MPPTFILGSGIIGVATAYYLSEHETPSSIHIVDPSPELFASASGYAGGFVAEDWFAPQSSSLGALSYSQHRKLAADNDGASKWGYAPTTPYSHTPAASRPSPTYRNRTQNTEPVGEGASGPPWLRRTPGDSIQPLSPNTAQVNPLQLCRFLLSACLARGVQLHHPCKALSIGTDAVHGELASIRIGSTTTSAETDFPCTRLLVAAGAWSPRVFASLFPGAAEVPVSGLAGYSLVFRPRVPVDACEAVFGEGVELFARKDGTVYAAGVDEEGAVVPEVPGEAKPPSEGMGRLRRAVEGVVCGAEGIEVVREGMCFRPVTERGVPYVCRVRDEQLGLGVATRPGVDGGVFLAAGHGPWGISLGPGTGMVMAEMMQGRTLSADVSGLVL